jgi:hypothetical protein
VLKGRAGEFAALKETTTVAKEGMTPLIEIPPVPWDFVSDAPAKSAADHVAKFATNLASSWGMTTPVLLDGTLLAPDDLVKGLHPLAEVVREARDMSVAVVPVWSPGSPSPYTAAVRELVSEGDEGLCLRLVGDDLADESTADAIATMAVDPSSVDVVLDLGAVTSDPGSLRRIIQSTLDDLPHIDGWRTLTVTATSFPVNLAGVGADSVDFMSRLEWQAWLRLFEREDSLTRLPTFGDYGIAHPDVPSIDPRVMQRSAQIRYTTDDDFLIVKGRSVSLHGSEQQFELAAKLVAMPEFHGKDFSAQTATSSTVLSAP